jgi:hypothetical protein
MVTQAFASILCASPDEDQGALQIDAIFDDCPAEIDWLTAAPARAHVGEQIALHVVAGADWSGITWSADFGTFDRQDSSETRYTCTKPGTHTITVEVRSRHADCPANVDTITVECVPDA